MAKFYGHIPLGLGDIPMPGRLIVVEGTDGVGRSTHIALLKEWLETEGYAVLDTGFRRSELTGDGIDRAMRGIPWTTLPSTSSTPPTSGTGWRRASSPLSRLA